MAQHPRLEDLRIERTAKDEPRARMLPWIVGAILLLAILATGWWMIRPKAVAVRTALARELTNTDHGRTVLNASGYVVARREATVSSKVTGKVTDVQVEEGLSVMAGQVLARLDDTNVQASLLLARAQLAAAEVALEETMVRLNEAEREWKRQASLKTGNVVAEADYDRAEAAAFAWRARLAQQQSELTVAERTIAVWQLQVDDTIIRAPFAGIVTSKNAQPGEMISPMSSGGFTRTGICTIVDMESLEIEVDVNESYINRVSAGQPVVATLDAYPSWKIPCRVIAIIPTADRQKSTVKVRVRFNELDPRILPQMAVKVAFLESSDTANSSVAVDRSSIVIPKSALHHQEGRDIVYVVQNSMAERRAVTVAGAQNHEVTISAGVSRGEKVVVEAASPLVDGTPVLERRL